MLEVVERGIAMNITLSVCGRDVLVFCIIHPMFCLSDYLFFFVQSEREDDRELPGEGLSPVAGFLLLISLGFACFLNSLSITV